ncbi:MAG: polysaccharide export outer membrane protein [Arenicella sp.]|jgi:polysaccharide export outer membrane protein
MKIILASIIIFFITSCHTENLFQTENTVDDKSELFDKLGTDFEPTIQPDDKLSISVWNHEDKSVGSAFSIYNTNESFGKWVMVEKDSTVKVPQIGSLKLGGMTLNEAEDSVAKIFMETIKNPIVEMKILNAEVTVLGEVVKPGNYLLERDINSLVEIIGLSEGLTSFAKSSQIQVIRNNICYKVDLTKMNQFEASNLYLKAKDIVYVPAVKTKKLHERAPTLIPFATMLTSMGVLISVLSK